MSYRSVGQASHMRHRSLAASASTQSSALQQRIQEKRTELENLKQLRDLSAGLAGQMGQLEQKLSTLSDGTEAIAAVMSNWHNVLRAITLASTKIPRPAEQAADAPLEVPQTLVRIPMQHIKPVPDSDDTDVK